MVASICKHMNPQVIVLDEAHYIKNPEAKRTLALLPFLRTRRRVILLTGTPAFAKPKEIFTLCHSVRPDLFSKFREFGNRYCNPMPSKFYRGISYEGAANTKELHFLLKKFVMIRRWALTRLKSEVLDELPPKTRQKIAVKVDRAKSEEILALLSVASRLNSREAEEDGAAKPFHDFGKIFRCFKDKRVQTAKLNESKYRHLLEHSTSLSLFQKAYKLTGTSKVPGVIEFCNQLAEQGLKFLVFAHHITVLDQLQKNFEDKRVEFVRIDGQVQAKARFECVGRFAAKAKRSSRATTECWWRC